MDGPKRTRTAVATESAGQAVLRRGPANALAADEERVMRMRLGASLPPTGKLEQIQVSGEAHTDLLARELEAYLHLRAAQGRNSRVAPTRPRAAAPSRTKEKIVRALRKKA